MLEKALLYGGWPGFVLLLVGNCAGAGAWLFYVLTRRYRRALYVTFMAFPFTFYAGRAAGLRAFDIPDFDQRVGLSTFMIVALFFVMLWRRRIRRPMGGLPRWIERFVWLYVLTLTLGQFFTHDAWSATLLSVGAGWEFLCLFYLLVSLIRRDRQLIALINSLFVFSILNILVRVVAKGESLVISPSSPLAGTAGTFGAEAGRVGSGALGPGVSYAGYLSVFITLALGMYFIIRSRIYFVYAVLMLVEMLNTFTRGGVFVLGLLVCLVLFKPTRVISLKVLSVAIAVAAVAWPALKEYVTLRGFSLNVMQVSNFQLRVELTRMFFHAYEFNWWGHGILQQSLFELTPWLIVPIHNAYLEILDTCGILPFIAFSILPLLMIWCGIRAATSRVRKARHLFSARFAPFVLVALLQWVLFANTTATSVLAYYPYEGTAVFWVIGLLPLSLLVAIRHARLATSPAVLRPVRSRPVPVGPPSPVQVS